MPLRLLQIGFAVLAGITLWLGVHRNGDTDTHALAFRPGETAGWNRISFPVADDISKADSNFIAWWSPGHVLAPIALQRLGVPPFRARAFLNVIGVFFGLWGTLALARAAGFDPPVGAWASLSLLLSPVVSQWWVYYGGGDVLAFGLAPWVFRSILLNEASKARACAGILLFGLGGFILKSSLLLLPLIWATYLGLRWAHQWWEGRKETSRPPPVSGLALGVAPDMWTAGAD